MPQTIEVAIYAIDVTVIRPFWKAAFWVLADAEGNEVCVCTWQGRD